MSEDLDRAIADPSHPIWRVILLLSVGLLVIAGASDSSSLDSVLP